MDYDRLILIRKYLKNRKLKIEGISFVTRDISAEEKVLYIQFQGLDGGFKVPHETELKLVFKIKLCDYYCHSYFLFLLTPFTERFKIILHNYFNFLHPMEYTLEVTLD